MEIVKGRKSVRTYDGRLLTEEDREKLVAFMAEQTNPYGIEIEYRFLDPAAHDLKSLVLAGETLYIGAKMKRVPHFEEALGYEMEALVLYAWSLGIGTVWIGGTMNRDHFEKAMELAEDDIMPCVTPVGYPAKKRAARDSMMRRAIRADVRKPLEQIVFVKKENAGGAALAEWSSTADTDVPTEVLEMIQWAPSAVNKQPWRMVLDGQRIHFYERPDKGYVGPETGDLQRIDVGIGMYHFVYGMEKAGKEVSFLLEDPKIAVPEDWQYVATSEF